MKIPYWTDTVTVFSKTTAENGRVNWISEVYSNCFWKSRALRERSGGAEFSLNGYVCRIPGIIDGVNIGDIIVYGAVNDAIDEYSTGKRSSDLIQKYTGRCMTVSAVRFNKGPVPSLNHLYTEGS